MKTRDKFGRYLAKISLLKDLQEGIYEIAGIAGCQLPD
jgi:hypothetical protein